MMSYADEARYGRISLLLLTVCPFTLRHVINDYHIKNGYTSLQDFLDKNKHDLYHILNRRCCCRLIQRRVTPMNRSQWDLFFIKNSSPCRTGYTGDCPCQYDAKPGVTSDVMDITLCCLFIRNICSRHAGINMSHVETIRTIRNHIIHAESAQLDVLTYNGYWNQVKTALLDLANHVSPTIHTDTLSKIQDLETRVMNAGELGEIRKLIVNEKRIEVVEERVTNVEKDHETISKDNEQVKKTVKETTERVTQIEERNTQTSEELKKLGDTVQKAAEHERGVQMSISHLEGEIRKRVSHVEKDLEAASKDNEQVKKNVKETAEKVTQIEGCMAHVERDLEAASKDNEQVKKSVKETAEKLTQIEGTMTKTTDKMEKLAETVHKTTEHERGVKTRLSQLEETVGEQGLEMKEMKQENSKLQADEADIRRLKQRLIKINTDITKANTISPLQESGKTKLPIELLFAQVVIKEDQEYRENGEQSAEHEREVKHPDNIFMMNGEDVRKVYLLGDAAHGKTTFCIWLVRNWCNAQHWDPKGSRKLDEWEKALKEFDFVFLLQFRHTSPDLASVIDMLCQDVFADDEDYWDTIRYVLSSNKYKSLIIMDGLDEWNPTKQAKNQLKCQGMPNLHMSSTVSCFYSMRPWVFSFISKLVKVSERVLEIHGLSDKGMEQVVENVLLNYYELKDDRPKFDLTYTKIMQNLCKYSLKSFMQIPLLAVVCVQILYEGSEVGNSMARFYAAMLNMLIERAHKKHDLETEQENSKIKKDNTLPEILSQHECIQNWISVLSKLGKVAYEGLISNETNLVFQKRKLEKEIGERDLQFALDVGLISQKEAPSLLTENVSLHFFHKSLQEFLAVIYIVTNKEAGDSFCKYLSNVKVIMELSNVIMFICGICPSLGSVISQRVVSVTDSDTEICEYRESPEHNKTVEELYKLQGSWYRELQDRQLDNPVTFHISDVYCWLKCDMETVSVTKELLSDPLVDIRSLNLQYAPIDLERGVTNTQLNDFLCNKYNNTRSLEMVYIYSNTKKMCVPPLCIPSLKCLHLDNVEINKTHLDGNVCPPLLSNMPSLHVLKIEYVTLGDGGLGLSGMSSLQVLKLHRIYHSDIGLDMSDMPSLKVLSLQQVNLHGRGLGLSGMPSLQVLMLKFITLPERKLDMSDMALLHELELWGVTPIDGVLELSGMPSSLKVLQLSDVKFVERGLDISDMTSLHELKLWGVTLGDRGLDLSSNMLHIENVMLSFVAMSATRWRQFLISVLNIQHRFNVELDGTNMDDESMTMIRSSPDFKVTKEGISKDMLHFGGLPDGDVYQLHFTRVWPPSHV